MSARGTLAATIGLLTASLCLGGSPATGAELNRPDQGYTITVETPDGIPQSSGKPTKISGRIDFSNLKLKSAHDPRSKSNAQSEDPSTLQDLLAQKQVELHFYFPDQTSDITSSVQLNADGTFGFTTNDLKLSDRNIFSVLITKSSPETRALQLVQAKLEQRVLILRQLLARTPSTEITSKIELLQTISDRITAKLERGTKIIAEQDFPLQIDDQLSPPSYSSTLMGDHFRLAVSYAIGSAIQGQSTRIHAEVLNVKPNDDSTTDTSSDQWLTQLLWQGAKVGELRPEPIANGASVAYDFTTAKLQPGGNNNFEVQLYSWDDGEVGKRFGHLAFAEPVAEDNTPPVWLAGATPDATQIRYLQAAQPVQETIQDSFGFIDPSTLQAQLSASLTDGSSLTQDVTSKLIQTELGQGQGYELSGDLNPLSEGAYTLASAGSDLAGNVADPTPLTSRFRIDRTAPQITIAQSGSLCTNDSTSHIVAQVQDWSPVTNTVARNGATVLQIQAAPTSFTSQLQESLPVSVAMTEGDNLFSITSVDAAGNASDAATVTIHLDTQAPQITLGASGPIVTNQKSFTLPIQVSDASTVTTTVYQNGTQVASSTQSSFSLNATLQETSNSFEVHSVDCAGNESIAKLDDVYLDTTPPSITIGTSDNQELQTPSFSFPVSIADDTATHTVVLLNNALIVDSDLNSFTVSATLIEGQNQFVIKSTDAAGNTSEAQLANIVLNSGPAHVASVDTSEVGVDPSTLVIQTSTIPVPDKLNFQYTAVSPATDIHIQGTTGKVTFPSGYAKIHFSYDPDKLFAKGLTQEFMVFTYDEDSLTWVPVDHVETNLANNEVIAYTSHFSTFVLTAAPTSNGTTPAAPACITADYPSGITALGGTGQPIFSTVAPGFKYYQDRDYFIKPTSGTGASATNATTFAALGLDGALGIATCDGYTGGATENCGTLAGNALYTTGGYVAFQAATDIDLYIMYDTRGGATLNDTSQDASWLSYGFQNTGYFVETTDPAQFYRVYKRSFSRGDFVSLDGNREGVTSPYITSNYWMVMKPRGVTTPQPASALCVAQPDTTPPSLVSNLIGVPGATAATLLWQNPNEPDFAGVVIRRDTTAPPATIEEGSEPTGTVMTPQSYRDTSVSTSSTYYYTVFSLDQNNNYQPGASVVVTTGNKDTDGDFLADNYERTTVYPATGLKSRFNVADTDGDGIPDGDEVAYGTDPTNGDTIAPVVTSFTLTSPAVTESQNITVAAAATDNVGVTGWLITENSNKPLANNTGWQATAPTSYALYAKSGTHTLYLWTKDAAGNVSDATTTSEISVQLYLWAGTIQDGADRVTVNLDLATDSQGDLIQTGSFACSFDGLSCRTYDGIPSLTPYISKYDNAGHHLWTKLIGSTEVGISRRVVTDRFQNITTAATLSTSGSPSGELLVERFDTTGRTIWTNIYREGGSIQTTALAVNEAGETYVTLYSSYELLKYDSSGVQEYDKVLRDTVTGRYESAYGIAVDPSGFLRMAGTMAGIPYVASYSPAGQELWSKTLSIDLPYPATLRLRIDSKGNMYISDGGQYVTKLDSVGNLQWTAALPGFAAGLAVDQNGDVFVSGEDVDNTFVSRLDANGNIIWTTEFGTPNSAITLGLAIGIDPLGSLFVSGSTQGSLDGNPKIGTGANLFITRLLNSGQRL